MRGPSGWPRNTDQVEVCELCGRPHRIEDLLVSRVEGLQDRVVDRFHGRMVTEPSHTDLKETSDPLSAAAAAATRRNEPYGMELWWEDI